MDDVRSDSRQTTEQEDTVLLSVNPRAGARDGNDRVAALEEALRHRGLVTERLTEIDEVARRSAACHAQGRLRTVVAAGGDGTVSVVLNNTPVGVPLAVLPLGTENLLARYFQLDLPPEEMADLICRRHTCVLDVGRANGRLFTLMLGVGFDAAVVREVDTHRTGHIHKWSYFKPIWRTLRSYRYPKMRVLVADRVAADRHSGGGDGGDAVDSAAVSWAFVVNLPRYAGGLAIAPQADGTDGQLDLCTLRRGRFWPGIKYFFAVLLRRHQRLQDCRMALVTSLRIESEEGESGEVPYQLDGDFGGLLPVNVDVIPARLRLIVPAGSDKVSDRSA